MLMASTVTVMASPGKVVTHQAWRRKPRPSLSIAPHSEEGGCAPTPRNDSAAPVRIAPATPSVATTMTGATMFGRMWRATMRTSPHPVVRAAST